jgi:hypothetical protein
MRKNLITLNHQFKQAIETIIDEFNNPEIEGIPSAGLLQACYLEAAQSCLPFVFDRDNLKNRLLIDLNFDHFHGDKLKMLMGVMPWFSSYICEDVYGDLCKDDMSIFLETLVHSMYGAGENNCDIGYYIDPGKIIKLAVANQNSKIIGDILHFIVDDFAMDNLKDESIGDKLSIMIAIAGKGEIGRVEGALISALEKINDITDEDGDRIHLHDDLIYTLKDFNLNNAFNYAINNLDFHPRSSNFYISLSQQFGHEYSIEQINRLVFDNPIGICQAKAEALLNLKLHLKHVDGYDLIFQNLSEEAKDYINSIACDVIEDLEEEDLGESNIDHILALIESAIVFSPEPEQIMKALTRINSYEQISSEIKSNPKLNRHLLASELSI